MDRGRLHGFGLQGLSAQSRIQSGHGRANFGHIATGIGGIEGFGGLNDRAVMVVQGSSSLRSVCAFALKGFIQGGAEDFPEFLFCFAVQRHRLRLHLPALLQGFDSVHPQSRGCTHLLGFLNQGLASVDAGLLGRL
jgi:hypothetical protein